MATGGSSFYKGSDLIHNYSCSKCEENDLNTDAQHFCPQCEHYLCYKCVKMHRDYFKKHVVYGRKNIQKWAGFSMDRCDQHGEKISVHCDDHQELCCIVCVALNHRLCSSISHLPDLAKGFLSTAEFKQLPAAVDKMRSRLDELKNARIKDQASLKDSYKNIIAEIKALRKEINTILDQLEKKTVEQLDILVKDLEKTIMDDMETCSDMQGKLKNMMERVQQITDKHKETHSYIGYRQCQTMLSETNTFVQEMQKRPVEEIMFKSDRSVESFLRDINSLGNVDFVHSMPNITASNHVYNGQGSRHYSVRLKNDVNKCHIVGICELPSGEVVIADNNNSRVKLLNNLFQVTDHCDILKYLKDMCLIASDSIAVACENIIFLRVHYEIHFLSVTRGKLQEERKFKTNHDCHSIAHYEGQLYLGSRNAVYQYTMGGEKVKTIYDDISGTFQIGQCAVSPDGERIYVTNESTHQLITLDKNGQFLSTLGDSELQLCTGLCVSPSGYVFVCGMESNTVLQVDRDGRQKLATVASDVHGLLRPSSVCFSEKKPSLIVGNVCDKIIVVKLC